MSGSKSHGELITLPEPSPHPTTLCSHPCQSALRQNSISSVPCLAFLSWALYLVPGTCCFDLTLERSAFMSLLQPSPVFPRAVWSSGEPVFSLWDSGNICLWKVLLKPLALDLDSSISTPFCWGRGGYWGLTARLAPENTSSQNSLSPLFALSKCSYRLIIETFSAPTLTFTHDFISPVFLVSPLFVHTNQYSRILYQAQISIIFECRFCKSS